MIKIFKKNPTFIFWLVLVFYELAGLGIMLYLALKNYWWLALLVPAIIFPPIAILIGLGINIYLSITEPYWWIIGIPIILITLIYPQIKIKS